MEMVGWDMGVGGVDVENLGSGELVMYGEVVRRVMVVSFMTTKEWFLLGNLSESGKGL